jgi:hypothetical protein
MTGRGVDHRRAAVISLRAPSQSARHLLKRAAREPDFDIDVSHAHLGETSVRRFRRGVGFSASGREFPTFRRGEMVK